MRRKKLFACLVIAAIALNAAGVSIATALDDTVTLHIYKLWNENPEEATLSYDANGGDEGTVPETITAYKGSNVLISDMTPTYSDHVFIGWDTYDPDAGTWGGDRYMAGNPFALQDDTTLYAQWILTPAPEEAALSYDANGGDEGTVPETITAYKGSNVLISDMTPTYADHEFVGWGDTAGAYDSSADTWTGDQYMAGDPFALMGDTKLYAQWRPVAVPTFTVTYDANGGTGGITVSGLPQGSTHIVLGVSETGVSKGFSSFRYWNTLKNGAGDTFNPGEPLEIDADMILYACWVMPMRGFADSVQVDVYQNGELYNAIDDPYAIMKGDDDEWYLAIPDLPKYDNDGAPYVYSVVERAPDGYTSKVFEQIDTGLDDYYFKVVNYETYEVTFMMNNGTGGVHATKTVIPPETVLGADMPPNPTGSAHAFLSWNTLPNGKGATFTSSTAVETSIYVYAQWSFGGGEPPPTEPPPTDPPSGETEPPPTDPPSGETEPPPTEPPPTEPPSGETEPPARRLPPGNGGTLVPGNDGSFIEIDDTGTPTGEWRWDEDEGEWIFEKYPPLGLLPATDGEVPALPFLLLGISSAVLGLALKSKAT